MEELIPNEYEFDFSDADVAAFESVATEDTANLTATTQEQQQQQQNLPPSPHSIKATTTTTATLPTSDEQQQQLQPQQQQQQQNLLQLQPPRQTTPQQQLQLQHLNQAQLHHHVSPLSPAAGKPAGKILLVPINSKSGPAGLKNLFQLPAGAINALTSSGNRGQIIQLAPLSTSSLNLGKHNYQFPITTATSQLLPGSSQGSQKHQQPQQLYITNSSPLKNQQTLNLQSVLNKSLNNLQNNTSLSSQFSSANLTSSRSFSYNDTLRASTPNSNAPNEVPKRKPCNCTKSQCLKLYCDCFANGEFCSGCNCTNCFNSLSKEKERQKAISQCLERNPEAFRPKIGKAVRLSVGEPAPDSIERRHTKGCNCKRSGCLKNYCECYEAKILCSNLCKCCGCKNYEESFERKSLMQLANSASENARGILKNLLPTNNNSSTGKEFTKCFITDKVIHASLVCLLQSAQQAEKDSTQANVIPNLIQSEMGKCLRMIVDSATESSSPKKR